MNSKTFKFIVITMLVLLVVAIIDPLAAQCAMCKATSESNLNAGGGDPKGLNTGILYIFLMPYILVGSMGLWWWYNRKSETQQVSDLTDSDFQQP